MRYCSRCAKEFGDPEFQKKTGGRPYSVCVSCRRAVCNASYVRRKDKAAEYARANAARISQRTRAWYAQNRARVLLAAAEYRARTVDVRRERDAAYRRLNAESIRQQQREYCRRNKDRRNAASRAYYKGNRDRLLGQKRAAYYLDPDSTVERWLGPSATPNRRNIGVLSAPGIESDAPAFLPPTGSGWRLTGSMSVRRGPRTGLGRREPRVVGTPHIA